MWMAIPLIRAPTVTAAPLQGGYGGDEVKGHHPTSTESYEALSASPGAFLGRKQGGGPGCPYGKTCQGGDAGLTDATSRFEILGTELS